MSQRPSSAPRIALKRRHVLGMAAAGALAATGARADEETIKIGVVVPLSGSFAASGQDELHGAQLAVDEINAAGGIKSVGGRKLELLPGDAGQTPESAVTAARRILNQNPVGAIGCWYSALTLAATQVAEQKKIPWITGSGSDAIVGRGFKYSYQISAGSEDSARGMIATIKNLGNGDVRLAMLTDNNAFNVEIKDFIKKNVAAPIVAEPTWTSPLSDATPAVTAVLRANPNFIYLGATSTTDQFLLLKQLAAQGNKALIIMGASSAANPAFLDGVGANAMEGLLVETSISFPGKGSEAANGRFVAATKQAFMDCEGLTGYVEVNVLALALEKAGKADAASVQQALQSLDVGNNPAASLLPGGSRLRFAPNGRRMDTAVQLLQWQSGRPVVVSPPDVANGQLKRNG